MTSRQVLGRSLRAAVDEHLRPRGFTGSLPHLRRIGEEQICLISLQYRSSGGCFVVEVAECGPEGYTHSWGDHVEPAKVTARTVQHPRPRLGSPDFPAGDNWIHFDTSEKRCAVVAAEVVHLVLHQAEPWWRQRLELRRSGHAG